MNPNVDDIDNMLKVVEIVVGWAIITLVLHSLVYDDLFEMLPRHPRRIHSLLKRENSSVDVLLKSSSFENKCGT